MHYNKPCFLFYITMTCIVGPSFTMFSTYFPFQNLVFGNLFQSSGVEITLESISPTF